MNELIDFTNSQVIALKAVIERDKKYFSYPFTNNCDHYYRLLLLHNRLESWEGFLDLLDRFKNKRCKHIERKSGFFEKLTKLEETGVPGFVTKKTLHQMIEYMRILEWKLEEQQGIWNENIQLPNVNITGEDQIS
ncbi:hypothetical protein LJK88_37560 [Paenibacillus sp. P26]|nr:hypothetical protein LJK88_37560 [Paenibacillus sp. P26]UUZ93364.1 hypothetical protein LJK87_00745 [Paenibacillus sp. P25]